MIHKVARMLGEDAEMLDAIVSNGNIVSVHTGTDKAITTITGHGIKELREMILNARRPPQEWQKRLEDFVSDPDIIARVKDKGPRSQSSGYSTLARGALSIVTGLSSTPLVRVAIFRALNLRLYRCAN